MIRYALACDAGHRFDSWFRDSATYDHQSAEGTVTCPACASTRVAKTVMAPAVCGARDVASLDAPDAKSVDVALTDEKSRDVRALLKSVRDKVLAEGRDVGARFPEEARRVHDGEAPVRPIYGQASIAEARDLLADGIMVLPLPIVPDELN